MKNTIVKPEVIELVKKSFISNLPFSTDRKKFIEDNIITEDLERYFSELANPEELKGLKIDNTAFESMNEYIQFTVNCIKLNVVTVMLKAAIKLKLISEEMTFDEKINYLIDLKNMDQINLLQQVVADTIENDLRKNDNIC